MTLAYRRFAHVGLWCICLASVPLVANAYCESHPTIKQETLESRSIVVAKVLSERFIMDIPSDPEGVAATVYRLQVKRRLSGKIPKTVEVISENTSGRFPMDVGSTYLLFVSTSPAGLFIDSCGHSDLISNSAETLRVIESQRRKRK